MVIVRLDEMRVRGGERSWWVLRLLSVVSCDSRAGRA